MHGGAFGTGAPKGNKNALKHGYYTWEAILERRKAKAQSKRLLELIELCESGYDFSDTELEEIEQLALSS